MTQEELKVKVLSTIDTVAKITFNDEEDNAQYFKVYIQFIASDKCYTYTGKTYEIIYNKLCKSINDITYTPKTIFYGTIKAYNSLYRYINDQKAILRLTPANNYYAKQIHYKLIKDMQKELQLLDDRLTKYENACKFDRFHFVL